MRYILTKFKIFENIQQAKSILKKVGVLETDDSYKQIREILKGHEGYVGMFVNLFYNKKYTLPVLSELYNYIIDNQVYIKMLPKNIITYDSIEKIQDDIEVLKLNSKSQKMYNEFPALQRKFLNINNDGEILASLANRRDSNFFFRKVSSYKSRKSLMDGIKTFLSVDPNANINRILDICDSNGSIIKYNSVKDKILIVRVFNSNQLTQIAGDCAWCIRNQGTFDSYVGLGAQYVIFLFDKSDTLSKIGATFRISKSDETFGYHTAHNRNDGYVDFHRLKSLLLEHKYDISNLKVDIDELKSINFDKISVGALLSAMTKEEIMAKKKVFSGHDVLYSFTKEEVEKWNLIDRVDFKSTSVRDLLRICSKDKILEEKDNFSLDDLSLFTKEEVSDFKLFSKIDFNNISVYALLRANISKEIIIENKKLYTTDDVVKSFTKEEVEKWNLIDKIDFDNASVKDLIHVLDMKKIAEVKNRFTPNDSSFFTPEQFFEWGLFDKMNSININILERFTLEEIKRENLLEKCDVIFISSIVVLYGKFGMPWIDYVKEKCKLHLIVDKFCKSDTTSSTSDYTFFTTELKDDGEFLVTEKSRWNKNYFKSIFKMVWFMKSLRIKFKSNDKLLNIMESHNGRSRVRISIKESIYYILKDIKEIFNDSTDIIYVKLLVDIGYDIEDHDLFFFISEDIFKDAGDFLINVIQYCKINKIDNSKYIKRLYEISLNDNLKPEKLEKLKLSLPAEKYKDVEYSSKLMQFRYELGEIKPYSFRAGDDQKFYEKWNDLIQSIDSLPKDKMRWYRDDDMVVAIALIYTKLNKLDELKIDIRINREAMENLNKIMSDTYITNGGMKNKLTEEERRKMYDWITNLDLSGLEYDRYSMKDEVKSIRVRDRRELYTSSLYIFDKQGFKDFYNHVKSVRYNVMSESFGETGEVPELFVKTNNNKTNRVICLKDIFNFFREKDMIDEYFVIVNNMIKNWKLSITEIKSIFYFLSRSYNYKSDKNKEVYSKFKKLLIDELIDLGASRKVISEYQTHY